METVGSISCVYAVNLQHGISYGQFVYLSDKLAGVWRFTVKYLLGLQPLRSVPIPYTSSAIGLSLIDIVTSSDQVLIAAIGILVVLKAGTTKLKLHTEQSVQFW